MHFFMHLQIHFGLRSSSYIKIVLVDNNESHKSYTVNGKTVIYRLEERVTFHLKYLRSLVLLFTC